VFAVMDWDWDLDFDLEAARGWMPGGEAREAVGRRGALDDGRDDDDVVLCLWCLLR